eukprot:scaffold180252_cov10-Tisochrysis_lutea.AAC.1
MAVQTFTRTVGQGQKPFELQKEQADQGKQSGRGTRSLVAYIFGAWVQMGLLSSYKELQSG